MVWDLTVVHRHMMMVHFRLQLLVFSAVLAVSSVSATKVAKCKRSKAPAINDDDVVISACDGPPCILRRKTEPYVTIKFTPDKDIQNLVKSVYATIVGIPFPFIGVDGTSACGNMYKEDGKTKASCPLKKGETYVFRDQFKILEIYPKMKLEIRWSLVIGGGDKAEPVICFELPARIL